MFRRQRGRYLFLLFDGGRLLGLSRSFQTAFCEALSFPDTVLGYCPWILSFPDTVFGYCPWILSFPDTVFGYCPWILSFPDTVCRQCAHV
ncbi:hypothetical protein GGR58DRAFT_451712 [Xylaria digitata]|nr:hypothetical protein GGR58DRAFT_451712 [Xylaria digitata]